MKKILAINGHPNRESYNRTLKNAYIKEARESGFTAEEIQIGDLKFDPSLFQGTSRRFDLEPYLEESCQTVSVGVVQLSSPTKDNHT